MTVIQNLPPELLKHILHLGSEPAQDLGSRTLLDFRLLSLVDRDWKEPAQQLLQFTVPRLTPRWGQALASTTGGFGTAPAVREAMVIHGLGNLKRAAELLQFLGAERVRVTALDLTGIGSLSADHIAPHLLAGEPAEQGGRAAQADDLTSQDSRPSD